MNFVTNALNLPKVAFPVEITDLVNASLFETLHHISLMNINNQQSSGNCSKCFITNLSILAKLFT